MCNKNTFDTANQLQLKAMVYIDGAVTQSNMIAHTKTHTHTTTKSIGHMLTKLSNSILVPQIDRF